MSAANLCEVVTKLAERGWEEAQIRAEISAFALEIMSFDERLAFDAGLLRMATRPFGLSLADRACLALARRLGLPAYTADRAWQQLSIGVEIRLTR